jgi:hypothetical protein
MSHIKERGHQWTYYICIIVFIINNANLALLLSTALKISDWKEDFKKTFLMPLFGPSKYTFLGSFKKSTALAS